jgi:predicted nucleotidyltransferase
MLNLSPAEVSEISHLVWSVRPDAKIWAFGSRTMQKFRSDSDLDLFVEGAFEISSKDISLIRDRLKQSSVSFHIDVVCSQTVSGEILEVIKQKRVPFL